VGLTLLSVIYLLFVFKSYDVTLLRFFVTDIRLVLNCLIFYIAFKASLGISLTRLHHASFLSVIIISNMPSLFFFVDPNLYKTLNSYWASSSSCISGNCITFLERVGSSRGGLGIFDLFSSSAFFATGVASCLLLLSFHSYRNSWKILSALQLIIAILIVILALTTLSTISLFYTFLLLPIALIACFLRLSQIVKLILLFLFVGLCLLLILPADIFTSLSDFVFAGRLSSDSSVIVRNLISAPVEAFFYGFHHINFTGYKTGLADSGYLSNLFKGGLVYILVYYLFVTISIISPIYRSLTHKVSLIVFSLLSTLILLSESGFYCLNQPRMSTLFLYCVYYTFTYSYHSRYSSLPHSQHPS